MSPKEHTDIVTPSASDGAKKRKWKFPGDLYFSCTHNTHNLAWAHLSLCFVAAGQTGLTCPVQPDNLRPVFTDTSPRPQLLEISLNQVMTLQSTFNKCLKVFLSTILLKMSYERLVKPVWRSGLSSHLTKRVQQYCEGFRCCQAYLDLTNEPHVGAYPNLKFARPRF